MLADRRGADRIDLALPPKIDCGFDIFAGGFTRGRRAGTGQDVVMQILEVMYLSRFRQTKLRGRSSQKGRVTDHQRPAHGRNARVCNGLQGNLRPYPRGVADSYAYDRKLVHTSSMRQKKRIAKRANSSLFTVHY